MKSISIWAHQHKTAARISIVFIYLLLNIIGVFAGDVLFSMGFLFPFFFYLSCILIVFTGLVIYPSKKNKAKYTNFYTRQKLADCLLISATFLLIVYHGNSINTNQQKNYNPVYGSSIFSSNADHLEKISRPVKNKNGAGLSKNNVRKNFKNTLKELRKKYTESTKSEKTILIILSILFALGLIIILGALSCSIACSGSEALADVVFFAGLGGIVFGLIKLIQRISRGKRKKHIVKPA
jgi:hypothetical protein